MQDIIRVMKIKAEEIQITKDLPMKNIPDTAVGNLNRSTDRQDLKIIFLSRISREKNLDYALKVLKKVTVPVVFDIYGPTENEAYWKECREIIGQLPGHIQVNYRGSVDADQVLNVFSGYDLFLFPTGGEAYGHVIAECLTVGTPVLLSTETPWRNMQADGLGWDIDLARMDSFVAIIEDLALMDDDERRGKRKAIKTKIAERLLDPEVLETNRRIFRDAARLTAFPDNCLSSEK